MIRFTIQNTNFWTFKLQRVRTFLAINILKRLPWPWPAIAHEKELLEETLSPIWSHVTSVSYLFDIFISVDYNSKAFWSHGYFFFVVTQIYVSMIQYNRIYTYIFFLSLYANVSLSRLGCDMKLIKGGCWLLLLLLLFWSSHFYIHSYIQPLAVLYLVVCIIGTWYLLGKGSKFQK